MGLTTKSEFWTSQFCLDNFYERDNTREPKQDDIQIELKKKFF